MLIHFGRRNLFSKLIIYLWLNSLISPLIHYKHVINENFVIKQFCEAILFINPFDKFEGKCHFLEILIKLFCKMFDDFDDY